MLNCYWCCYFS